MNGGKHISDPLIVKRRMDIDFKISAKHEGGDPEDEQLSSYPSDILHYFRTREEINESGDMKKLRDDYLLKHFSVNNTARALTREGIAFLAAENLHGRNKLKEESVA